MIRDDIRCHRTPDFSTSNRTRILAEQSRLLIVPRSLEQRSSIEQTGEYVINSLFVQAFFLVIFRFFLSWFDSSTLAELGQAITQMNLSAWGLGHRHLLFLYFGFTLVGGYFFGFVRGVLALNQPIRTALGGYRWFSLSLERLGIHSFLQADPVWYGVLRQTAKNELTFMEVRMKNNSGYYTGELQSYGLVPDSEREKDLYLVNVYFKNEVRDEYRRLDVDGVLLNFADVLSIEIKKRARDST